MAQTLAFHLGDFKTGTTAIQDWPGAAGGIALLPGAPHVALAHAVGNRAAWADGVGGLSRAAAAAPADIALVSAEHFEFVDPALMAEAAAAALPEWRGRLRLVAYVRPHAQAFLARYGESAKIGSFRGPPEDYLDLPQTLQRMRYAPRFARWRKAWGEAFTLRLYDRARFPDGDVRRDLARTLTGRDPGPLPPPRDANPSLGLTGLAMARALHAAIDDEGMPAGAQGARWTLGREIGRLLAAESGADAPLALDRPLARAVAERFGEDAAALDAGFFGSGAAEVPGPMAAALAAALDAAPATTPRPDPAALPGTTTAAMRAWGRMLARGLTRDAGAMDRLWHESGG